MSDKAVADGLVVHPGRSTRTLKIHFTEPVTFGFFWFSPTGRSAPEAGRSALGLGRCLLFHRTVRSVIVCFCSVAERKWIDMNELGLTREDYEVLRAKFSILAHQEL